MKRILAVLIVALLACGSLDARPKHWYTDWKFWAGEAVIGGAVIADGRSTCLGFSRGLVEGNAVGYGSNSCTTTAATLSIGAAAYTGLHIWEYRISRDDPSKTWRTIGLLSIPAVACAFHCTAAIRNYNILPPR